MGAMVELLRDRLAKMGPAERTELVARFPKAHAAPRPQTLHQLAARLLAGLRADAAVLTRGEVQVLEASVALSGETYGRHEPAVVVRSALESMLDVGNTVTAARLEEVLDQLAARALVLSDDGLGVLRVHPTAVELFRAPLGRPYYADHAKPPRRALLEPERPVLGLKSAHENAAAGQAAAATALARLDRVLEAFAEPWPALKKGGIAVAEVRRLGRLLHVPADEARLWLHLAAELDLIAAPHGLWRATKAAAAWGRADPAARLADLGRALLGLSALPLVPIPDGIRTGQSAPALSANASVSEAGRIRRTVLCVLAELPDGCGAVPDERLAAAVYDRAPILFAPYGHRPPLAGSSLFADMSIWGASALEADAVTEAVMRETTLLALTADDALTDLGRALLQGADGEQLLQAAAALLPLKDTAAVLADHLVLVTGVPTPALADFLGALCDVAGRDAHAPTWRISPTSVRAFFDAYPGTTADEVLEQLAAFSSTPVPQTVDYLIRDTAARHGHVRVARPSAVLDVRDEALATELTHHRQLHHLGLRRAGPTVLLADADITTVLRVLREHGYAPTGPASAAVGPARPPGNREEETEGPSALPRQTRGRGRPRGIDRWLADLPTDTDAPGAPPLAALIGKSAPVLGRADCVTLAEAIGAGGRVRVEYQTGSAMTSAVTVQEPRLEGKWLMGKSSRYPMPLRLKDLHLVLPLPAPRGSR